MTLLTSCRLYLCTTVDTIYSFKRLLVNRSRSLVSALIDLPSPDERHAIAAAERGGGKNGQAMEGKVKGVV